MEIPATKLRGENGEWERPPTCCLVDQIADSNPDEDKCDESQMEVCPEQQDPEISHTVMMNLRMMIMKMENLQAQATWR